MTHGVFFPVVYFYLWYIFIYGVFLPMLYFYLWCIFIYGIFLSMIYLYLLFLFKVYFSYGKFISIIGIDVCF